MDLPVVQDSRKYILKKKGTVASAIIRDVTVPFFYG